MQPKQRYLCGAFLLSALVGLAVSFAPAAGPSIVGDWITQGQEPRIQISFGAGGMYSQSTAGGGQTRVAQGRYVLQGNVLSIHLQGQSPSRFTIRALQTGRLVLAAADGSTLDLVRAAGQSPDSGAAQGRAPVRLGDLTGGGGGDFGEPRTRPGAAPPAPASLAPAPAPPGTFPPARNAAPVAAPQTGAGPGVPAWVRPGMRLTYYVMTGSLSGSVNGYVLNDEGEYVDQQGNRYSTERVGHSSHGLVQATVAGMEGSTVALSQPFYLFNGNDRTPVYNTNLDALVTADTGGDYWMHPQKQALMRQQHPAVGVQRAGQLTARTVTWRQGGKAWTATAIKSQGDTGRTFWVFDQATGHLLYLSRLTRQPPDIRDHSKTLPDSVSYATFLRFVASRQLNLPWLDVPMPAWVQQLQTLQFRGQTTLQFTGSHPGGQPITQQLQVARRGHNWLLFQSSSQMQPMPGSDGAKSVAGVGSVPPIVIPPEVLARLRPGQVIDRDPQTGFTTRVTSADAQSVALQTDGPRQTTLYVFERAQGLLVRTTYRERMQSGDGMVKVRDMQLVGKR